MVLCGGDFLNKVELKNCPFCGGNATIKTKSLNDGYCGYYVKCIMCENCGIQTRERTCDGYYGEYCSDEEIAEIWNRRI